MFEVGKKYIFNGFVMECLWVSEDNAILRNLSKPWLDGVYASDKNNFKAYKEYKEPKIYTQEMTVCQHENGRMYTNGVLNVIGEIRITYTEGSGLTVDVLE